MEKIKRQSKLLNQDIRDLFGSIKVDLKSDRIDWKEMKRELYTIKRR